MFENINLFQGSKSTNDLRDRRREEGEEGDRRRSVSPPLNRREREEEEEERDRRRSREASPEPQREREEDEERRRSPSPEQRVSEEACVC